MPAKRTPVITLLTDFGLSDHFAGVMKGVILAIAPDARIVDISHEVTPFEIAEGGFLIAQSWRYFPKGTIHVCVVDPGVGSNRRPILVEAGGHYFVAPDNGLLTMIYAGTEPKVRHITAGKYFLQPVSNTFHGRDVFAPVAAHLAKGVLPSRFGKPVDDYAKLAFDRPVRTARRGWTGSVLKIDRFGNLTTNFLAKDFPYVEQQAFQMIVGLKAVDKLASNYATASIGELFLIVGSSGYLEVAASQANAARILGCGVGAPVELRMV